MIIHERSAIGENIVLCWIPIFLLCVFVSFEIQAQDRESYGLPTLKEVAPDLLRDAERGSTTAQIMTGWRLVKGGGIMRRGEPYVEIQQDYREGMRWLMLAAGEGLHRELYPQMAKTLTEGNYGIPIDHERAFELNTLGYEAGDKHAMEALAEQYLLGRGTSKDQSKGLEVLIKAGNRGSRFARYHLGYFYENGIMPDGANTEKAMEWYQMAASAIGQEYWTDETWRVYKEFAPSARKRIRELGGTPPPSPKGEYAGKAVALVAGAIAITVLIKSMESAEPNSEEMGGDCEALVNARTLKCYDANTRNCQSSGCETYTTCNNDERPPQKCDYRSRWGASVHGGWFFCDPVTGVTNKERSKALEAAIEKVCN